jgi:peptidoglycan/LPS O-acetylase OafA/YrhL
MPQQQSVLDFFFITSGFFACYSSARKQNVRAIKSTELIVSRGIRILPMAVLGTSIAFSRFALQLLHRGDFKALPSATYAYIFGSLLIPVHTSLIDFDIQNLFPFNPPLWFIFFDFLAYLLFAILLRFLSLIPLCAIAALAGIGLWHSALDHNNLFFSPNWWGVAPTIPRVIFDVTMGCIIFRLYRQDRFIDRRLWFVPIALLLFVTFVPLPYTSPFCGAFQAFASTVIMPISLAMAIRIEAPAIFRPIAAISGRISMAVYALHLPIIRLIYDYLWKILAHSWGLATLLSVEFFIPVSLAYLATIYIDEPVRATLSSVKRKLFSGDMSSTQLNVRPLS